jgi:hypothetical protein
MPDPTAALHGAAKTASGVGSSVATLDSDSASVTNGDWLMVLIGGGSTNLSNDYTIAKQAGTATVGASVTPTSPLSQVADVSVNDGGFLAHAKTMYLPVTGDGTLTVRITRTAGTVDFVTFAAFVRVQNPGGIGAVGVLADNPGTSTQTNTLDAAPAGTSLLLGQIYNNAGNGACTQPSGTVELTDQNNASFGTSHESFKKEGSGSQVNQWTGLANLGAFYRCSVVVEITTAGGGGGPAPVGKLIVARQSIVRAGYY